MNRIILVVFSFFIIGFVDAQVKPKLKKLDFEDGNLKLNDTLNSSLRKGKSNKFTKNKDATIDL